MLFNSWEYLVFLPIVVLLYYLLQPAYRWVLLLVASCFFYMFFIPKYVLILFALILIDYTAGILIERAAGNKKKAVLWISLAANIVLLGWFKYANFTIDNVNVLMTFMGINQPISHLDLILPIGLSFHTFQSMAYTIEVYRGNQKPERHLGYYAVYVLFFPQMVAGPIERYATLGNQLRTNHPFQVQNLIRGIRLVLFGLVIKMAIADPIAPLVNEVYASPTAYSGYGVALAILAFSIQIYADFWGYSTIALGSARMLGIELIDNFKAPYLAYSISSFWSKWHISLSTWFRDYVYIPLGGNRTSVVRWVFNIMLVFALSGLWHGANWTFLIWGCIHAGMYLVERGIHAILGESKSRAGILVGWIFTFVGVSIAWVFFRAASFNDALLLLKQLGTSNGNMPALYWQQIGGMILIVLFDLMLRGQRIDVYLSSRPEWIRWVVYTVLFAALLVLSGGDEQPFIYFQF